ncbi:unnamed protein product [Chondrus crispus]|uniref:Transketolase-like pyrimidine-binding domain-containing protein n=1 Tax=Chondrus crispus TaxID=2769 RepID=R7Q4P2_CHOCR|nr:unnamed protein product [Chondrus crispus]CDF32843.1 unnamed protein product [Chondrus crispus]|eukprot:XP_005712644.1 unnamed protein product [Chondrus crispus]
MIVILNDNDQVSLPTGTKTVAGVRPSGALSDYTSRLMSSRPGIMAQGGTLFEELGFYYVGPIDGHKLDTLVPVLENVRDMPGNKPVLIHVKTEKGKGYPPAEASLDKYHGVARFDVGTGKQHKSVSQTPSYTSVFSKALIAEAEHDRKVVAITAAMPGGTGLNIFGERFLKRCHDVGIAEQPAVTMAGGMACEGYSRSVASTQPSCNEVTINSFTTFPFKSCLYNSFWTARDSSETTDQRIMAHLILPTLVAFIT